MEGVVEAYIAEKLRPLEVLEEKEKALGRRLSKVGRVVTRAMGYQTAFEACVRLASGGEAKNDRGVKTAMSTRRLPVVTKRVESCKSPPDEIPKKSDELLCVLPRARSEKRVSTAADRLFECTFEPIVSLDKTSGNFVDAPFDDALTNYDKLYLRELLEFSEGDEEESNGPRQTERKLLFQSFCRFLPPSDPTAHTCLLAELDARLAMRRLAAQIEELEVRKQNLVRKFNSINVDAADVFQFSVFSSIYLRSLPDDFAKARNSFVSNEMVTSYLRIYQLLVSAEVSSFEGFVADIRGREEWPPASVENKLRVEKIIEGHPSLLDFSVASKRDKLTCSACYFIRDIVFHHGVVNNVPFVSNNVYNTAQHYKYLLQKKSHLKKLLRQWSDFLKSI